MGRSGSRLHKIGRHPREFAQPAFRKLVVKKMRLVLVLSPLFVDVKMDQPIRSLGLLGVSSFE